MMNERKANFPNQQAVSMSENESILILRAFILDTQIENPEGYVIANGKKVILLSDLLAQNPDMLREMIEERAEVFCQLGWEVPDAK